MVDWKIVPVEPSEEMQEAWGDCDHQETAADDWRVMLAASPRASEDEALVERVVDGLLEADKSFRGCDPSEYWPYMARTVIKMLEGGE